VSVVDVLLVVGLGAAGFLVVALVCAAVLGMLHMVLPDADSGAAAADDGRAAVEAGTASPDQSEIDTGPNP
jgi:hypothetical protein